MLPCTATGARSTHWKVMRRMGTRVVCSQRACTPRMSVRTIPSAKACHTARLQQVPNRDVAITSARSTAQARMPY